MLTISQVAEIAGVSVATISRVVNNSPLVTESTKQRVRKVIDELDYHPNVVARSLRSSKSRALLALVPNISNPFHAEIVHGINKIVYAHDYNLLLCETHGIREREHAFFSMLKRAGLLRSRAEDEIGGLDMPEMGELGYVTDGVAVPGGMSEEPATLKGGVAAPAS